MAPLASGMKRRHFLKALGTAAVALALPSIAAPAAREGWGTGSARPNLTSKELMLGYEEYARLYLTPAAEYLAVQIDSNRIDVLFGWAKVRPEYAVSCRIES